MSRAAWLLLRLSVAGHGRAWGVLTVWLVWDWLISRLQGFRAARRGGFVRYARTRRRGPATMLASGTIVRPGDPLIELHLDNRILMAAAASVPRWELRKPFLADLQALEAAIQTGELEGAVAFHGVSLLGPLAQRLGFEVRALPRTRRWRLVRFYMVGLLAIYHPDGWRAAAANADRWPTELWRRPEVTLGGVQPDDAVRAQYGGRAGAYARSAEHAAGDDLVRLIELLAPERHETALDVATGAGFTAFALAPLVSGVVALDLTPEMLAEGQRLADERGIFNVEFVPGDAHALPFADAKFDIVTVRRAPHHFADVDGALREMRRVLKPGGRLALVDQVAPEEPAARALLHELERQRDPSHVRALAAREWQEQLTLAGFEVRAFEILPFRRSLGDWLRLAGTPPERSAGILARLAGAGQRVQERLGYQDAGDPSFVQERCVVLAAPVSGH